MFGCSDRSKANDTEKNPRLVARDDRAQQAGGSDQVPDMTASDGWEYMPDFDSLPPVVRRRLAESRHNICAACMEIEAHKITRSPTARIFIEVIEAIERELDHPRSSK